MNLCRAKYASRGWSARTLYKVCYDRCKDIVKGVVPSPRKLPYQRGPQRLAPYPRPPKLKSPYEVGMEMMRKQEEELKRLRKLLEAKKP